MSALGELELCRERLPDRDALVAERRERACRPAKLEGQRVRRHPAQTLSRAGQSGEPNSRFVGESDRQRLLHQGAARHHGRAVFFDQRGERPQRRDKIGAHDAQRPAGAKGEPRIDDILARGAPVDVAARLLVDFCGQRLDQRDPDIAGERRPPTDLSDVIKRRVAGGADRRDAGGRDDANLRLCRRQPRLELQHRLQHGAVGEDFINGRGGED